MDGEIECIAFWDAVFKGVCFIVILHILVSIKNSSIWIWDIPTCL